MGKTCAICKAKSPHLSFHRFPENHDLRQTWIEKCSVPPGKVTRTTFICNQHFRESDYDTFFPQAKLKKGAVPSLGLPNGANIDMEHDNIVSPNATEQPQYSAFHENASVPSTSVSKQVSELGEPELQGQSNIETPQGTTFTSPQRNIRYVGELDASHFQTPRRAKRHLELVRKNLDQKSKTIKKLRIENSRLKHRLDSFKNVLETLHQNRMISEHAMQMLQDDTPDTLKLLFDRQLKAKRAKYSPELRAFALTLNFYSPRGYNFLRKRVKNLLPHPETIRRWYKVVDGEPGFTNQAFEAIKLKCQESPVFLSISLDEMSIREHIDYTPTKVYGFVDMGCNLEGNGVYQTKARSVLVIMAVAITGYWKIPLGYFVINSLNGYERANIIKICLELLQETGAQCTSITFDGAPVNISMCTELGCKLSLDDCFALWFKHPLTGQKIYVFYDPVHMIKLVRNTFGEKDDLKAQCGDIKFSLIKELHYIGKRHGLRAGTKLTKSHIFFENEKMKVRLAVQVLSSSVSSALFFCKCEGFAGFQDCDATAEFFKNMNDAFDILNCKNFCSTSQFCKPLRAQSYHFLSVQIHYLIDYIKSLKILWVNQC